MRLFGIQILLAHRHDAFVDRHKRCMAELRQAGQDRDSFRNVVSAREEEIEGLKDKCSRVNVSRLENYVGRLEDALKAKGIDLPSNGLSEIQRETETSMLGPLDGITNGNAE